MHEKLRSKMKYLVTCMIAGLIIQTVIMKNDNILLPLKKC